MSSSSSTFKIHPVLLELGLVTARYQPKRDRKPSCADILNQLLLDNVVTESAVRDADKKQNAVRNNRKQQHNDDENILQTPTSNLEQPADSNFNDNITSDSNGEKDTNSIQNKNNHNINNSNSDMIVRHRYRHIALHVYYDGGKYSGLAENVGTANDQSIERALFTALIKSNLIYSRDTSNYSRCGRTDKGVSATGQIIAMKLKSAFAIDAAYNEDATNTLSTNDLPNNSTDKVKVWVLPRNKMYNKKKHKNSDGTCSDNSTVVRIEREMTEYAYDNILNNLLPPDIRILGWCPVSDDFSARFSAMTRTYRYFFIKRQQMNIEKMKQGLSQLIGTHDYRNFCKMDVEKVYNFERTIIDAKLIETNDDCNDVFYFQITGQAFLWHQIRCIAHILFLIGRELEEPTVVTELLNVKKYSGKPSYPLADEHPLVLYDCQYSNLHMGYSVSNLWYTQCHLEQQWEELILAAARIRNGIKSFQEKMVSADDITIFCSTKRQLMQKKQKNTSVDISTHPTEPKFQSNRKQISWNEALVWLKKYGFVPEPDPKKREISYTPLLQRSMGTTYEEKIQALKNSTSGKRLARYEENVIRKRKTKEEDAAFYDHMTKQGGSAL